MDLTKFYKRKPKRKFQFSHIILMLTIQTVVIDYSAKAIKIKCTYTDNFYFTNPGSECGAYYKCTSKGQKEVLECNPDQKFNFYQQNCSHSLGKCFEPTCIGRPNGIYQDTSHACMRSFTCYAGQLTSVDNCPSKQLHNGQKCIQQDQVICGAPISSKSMICPYDYTFDTISKQCLPKNSIINFGNNVGTISMEKQICRNKVDGAISDPTSKDCTTYVMCKAGKYDGRRRCSSQAVFNGESCVPSPLHQCSLNKRNADIRSTDQCQRKLNGYYAYPQHGCTSYMRCISEQMVEVGVCSTGQYFDMEIRKCVYESVLERRRCFERGVSKECEARIDGYYAEAKCDSYYYCHSGYKIEYKCSPGKVFNGHVCVAKTEYKCPKTENDTFCNSRPDGYYKDTNDGCRAYAYCSNGHKITYICESGYVFDTYSKKCVQKELLPMDQCRSDYVCYGKSDGYHVDLKSNCRTYVYCINSEKITQITCRDGKIFNGQKCVPPTEYACPSLYYRRQINCVPRNCLRSCKSNGFYIDLGSRCRDFHICINGKSSKSSCQAGMRFNGEICIAEDKFTCPTICRDNYEFIEECPVGRYVA